MKKCPYCGKEHPDDATVCSIDQTELTPLAPPTPSDPAASRHRTIIVRRFTVPSLFKIAVIGCFTSIFGFFVLMWLFALFGAHTVSWNRVPVTGGDGLIIPVFMGAVSAGIFTILGWVGFMIGFWLFSLFGRVTLRYLADEETIQTDGRGPAPSPTAQLSP